jgi:disulfide bond formation protein DsbB
MLRNRFGFLLVLITALGALVAALFSQHVLGMLPCAWCILQRGLFLLIAGWALIGFLGASFRFWCRLNWILILTTAIAGIATAWHQLTVAAKAFSCDQTLADRIISTTGLDASVPWFFGIYATCLDASVKVLGLDFAAWGLVLFSIYALYALVMLVQSGRRFQ